MEQKYLDGRTCLVGERLAPGVRHDVCNKIGWSGSRKIMSDGEGEDKRELTLAWSYNRVGRMRNKEGMFERYL